MQQTNNTHRKVELNRSDILAATNLGLWMILMDEKSNLYEMYADETMYRVMEAAPSLSPEECYEHWFSRINPNYITYVNRAVSSMVTSGKVVQLHYLWTHPTLGNVQVRCVGVRREDKDGMICLEGYHRMINSLDHQHNLVQMHADEEDRSVELENLRIRDFYRASLSDSIAYAELDMESDQIQNTGGIWADCEQDFDGKVENFLQYLIDRQHEYTSHKYNEKRLICADTKELRAMMESGKQTQRFIYKCLVDNEWRWVELVIHTFRDQIFQNLYALLYLKDVDSQKKHELAQQEAAETDPLTKVYNRKTFEREVRLFLKDETHSGQGSLILLDIDDFKSINDNFGHLTGYAALKQVAYGLESVFYKKAIIGRFGGDEFLVFVRDETEKEKIEAYMNKLFSVLEKNKTTPIQYSAGIIHVSADNFIYTEALRLADEALYTSKKKGKNQFTWSE